MKSNTATATTATADHAGRYRGRFAPSPTGALHLGSLVAALGSYLDARSHDGHWLVRIEDLDTPRIVPGAAEAMLATLARLGMRSDSPILYQSTRIAAYEAALGRLQDLGTLYPCSCSRRETASGPYPGTCRNGPTGSGPYALRLRLPAGGGQRFDDDLQGPQRQPFEQLGDPVLRRRDGQIAYQLAVVVDDDLQGITHVVRGADLLPSTAWQLQIRALLGMRPVRHAHLPVVVEANGDKLAKSASSTAIASQQPAAALFSALQLMRQEPPRARAGSGVADILDWATRHWRPQALAGLREIRIPRQPDLGL